MLDEVVEKPSEFEGAAKACAALQLDGLVVIGGDDSNTNAAVLAEYFLQHGSSEIYFFILLL